VDYNPKDVNQEQDGTYAYSTKLTARDPAVAATVRADLEGVDYAGIQSVAA